MVRKLYDDGLVYKVHVNADLVVMGDVAKLSHAQFGRGRRMEGIA